MVSMFQYQMAIRQRYSQLHTSLMTVSQATRLTWSHQARHTLVSCLKDPVGKVNEDELDTISDIALIYMRAKLPTLDPAPSGRVGDWVVELGNPLGEVNYATFGIITKITDSEYYTDAPTNHGNSGGPLLDSEARVLGIVSWGRLIPEKEIDPGNKSDVLDAVNGISAAKRLSNACAVIYSASPKCPFSN